MKKGIDYKPGAILTTATMLNSILRSELEKYYQCPVVNMYSLNETGHLEPDFAQPCQAALVQSTQLSAGAVKHRTVMVRLDVEPDVTYAPVTNRNLLPRVAVPAGRLLEVRHAT